MSELTAKQARFVNEYIRTLNVTQSAIKAGYSANSAHVTGCRLLMRQSVMKQKLKKLWSSVGNIKRTHKVAKYS